MKVPVEKETKKNIGDCAEVVTRTTPIFMAVSEVLSILVFLGGIAVLVGWVLNIPGLKSVFPNLVTMKANTALCFSLSGFSLWTLQIKRRDIPRFRIMAAVCSLAVLGIGLATIVEYLSGWDLGIDQFLFKELPGAVLTSSPGRMAFNTAINFTITGLATCLFVSKTKSRCLLAQILVLPVGIISVLSLIGYLYKAPPLFLGLALSTAMALHTTVLFIALFFGILYCRPGCGVMTLVSSDAIGGKLIRRIFPVAILLPVTLGWLKLQGERSGVITNEFGVSFVAVGNLTFMALYIYGLSFWIEKTELGRLKVEAKLKEAAEEWRRTFDAISDSIFILDKDHTIRRVNRVFLDTFGLKEDQVIGKKCYEVVHKSDKPWMMCPHRLTMKDHKAHTEEVDDPVLGVPLLVSTSPIFDEQGELAGSVHIAHDITERKKAETALQQKVAELEQFNKIAIGRELKMIELKEKIKALEEGKR